MVSEVASYNPGQPAPEVYLRPVFRDVRRIVTRQTDAIADGIQEAEGCFSAKKASFQDVVDS